MRPDVSVVIPTHKRPVLMAEAVKSVAAQAVPNVSVEIIVVFDACPIELPSVELPVAWSLTGIANVRTRGLAGARNTGITAATGEYVAFLDDDDVWLPGKLQAQLDRFAQQPDSVLVGTAMTVDDGKSQHVRLVPAETLTHVDFVKNRNPGLHSSSFMFRRETLLGALGLIDEDLPRSYGEDYDILLRSARLGVVSVVNQPLVKVLWKGQSYYFGQWADYATALQYLLAKHPEFSGNRAALGRIQAQVSFALASSGQAAEARSWARRAIKNDPRQIKAYLAVAISYKIVTPDTITRITQKFGRGI